MKPFFEVVELPPDATAEQIKQALNRAVEDGYVLRNFMGDWPSTRACAVFKPGRPKAKTDGKDEEAIRYIRQNPDLSLRTLVIQLKAMGISRTKDWIWKKRLALASGVSNS
jgi:hypothetical protein